MTAEAETEEEPSIEEILDSIRQIISDEDVEEDAAEEKVLEAPAEDEGIPDIPPDEEPVEEPVPDIPADEPEEAVSEPQEPDEEVIDLTEKVEEPEEVPEEEGPVEEVAAESEPEAEQASEPEDDFDALLDGEGGEAEMEVDMQDPVEDEVADVPESAGIEDLDVPAEDDGGNILTEGAEEATAGAIAALAAQAAVERAGNVTIEDIVREEMRPILRAWLDKNLPGIIERLMKKELERISKDLRD